MILIALMGMSFMNSYSQDNLELSRMVMEDQKMRESDNDTIDMEPIDKLHRQKVMQLIVEGKTVTNKDKTNAALILQHTALTFCNNELVSISPENYYLAYLLSKSAFENGDENAGYFCAVTYDRYMLYTEGYQKYGTQRVFEEETGNEVWAPIDPKTTDAERAAYNVPKLSVLLSKYKMKPLKTYPLD